jgi:hypothetical protein
LADFDIGTHLAPARAAQRHGGAGRQQTDRKNDPNDTTTSHLLCFAHLTTPGSRYRRHVRQSQKPGLRTSWLSGRAHATRGLRGTLAIDSGITSRAVVAALGHESFRTTAER